jgi:hypothetical protein
MALRYRDNANVDQSEQTIGVLLTNPLATQQNQGVAIQ